jgi:hypothetical protein
MGGTSIPAQDLHIVRIIILRGRYHMYLTNYPRYMWINPVE